MTAKGLRTDEAPSSLASPGAAKKDEAAASPRDPRDESASASFGTPGEDEDPFASLGDTKEEDEATASPRDPRGESASASFGTPGEDEDPFLLASRPKNEAAPLASLEPSLRPEDLFAMPEAPARESEATALPGERRTHASQSAPTDSCQGGDASRASGVSKDVTASRASDSAQTPSGQAQQEPGYRVKKLDGRILGPYDLEALNEMAEKGEIAPGDQLARDEDEFRLLSQYPECRDLLEKAAGRYRVKPTHDLYRPTGRRTWPAVVGGTFLVIFVAGLATFWMRPEWIPVSVRTSLARLVERPTVAVDNPVVVDLPLYRLQVLEVGGDVTELIDRANFLMAKDTPLAYGQADTAFKAALLAEPHNPEAIGGFILNTVFMHAWSPSTSTLQRLLSYTRYLEATDPEHPSSLLSRAAMSCVLGTGMLEAGLAAKRAVEALEEDGLARLVFARALAATNQDKAIALLSSMKEEQVAPPRLPLELASVCMDAGDYACAERALRDRLELDPHHQEATASLVDLFVLTGHLVEARRLYGGILSHNPRRADAVLAMAVLDYQVEKDIAAAHRGIQRAHELRRDLGGQEVDLRIRVHEAVLARLNGQTDRANDVLSGVFEVDPHHGPASYQLVLLALEEGDVALAFSRLPAAIAGIDEPARRFLLRSLVYAARENFDEAAREARRAMAAWPEALEPLLLTASLEARRGQTRAAYALLRQTVSMDPLAARQSRELTDYWDGVRLESEILAGFDSLVEHEPRQAMAHVGRGIARWLVGDQQGARASFSEAIRLDEENLSALVYRGVLELEAGRLPRAARAFRRAGQAEATHPMPEYLMGRVEERRGARESARAAYLNALRSDQAFAPARIRKALLQARAGEEERAVEVLRALVASEEKSTAARVALFEIDR